MKVKKIAFVLLFLWIGVQSMYAQLNEARDHRLLQFEEGQYFFNIENYNAAIIAFEKFIKYTPEISFENFEKLQKQAKILSAIAALRLEEPASEHNLIQIIDLYYPEAITTAAITEIASYYYNQQNYQQAIDYYNKIDLDQLGDLERSEASFKKAYCLFIQQKFKEAKMEFARTKDIRNDFYYQNNYYSGMCDYFMNDYKSAGENFRKVANAPAYSSFIPYYLCQIYFAQKDYDRLIGYGEQKINESDTKNIKDIRLLLGQAYYIRNDFQRALPHLEYYEQNTEQLTEEEFYQLAFTQYQTQNYENAQDNFQQLTNLENRMGQMANYYLADCFQKSGDKLSARTAFKKVSQMEFDRGMQEEALFNFGKISAEMSYDRDALAALIEIPESSPYHLETQNIINDILLNSGDYINSINLIESLPKISEKLKATYQVVTLKQALQLYNENEFEFAKLHFEKSLKYQKERSFTAQSYYWLAKIAQNERNYNQSIDLLNEYFKVGNGLTDLPEESADFMANYTQGYNHLKLNSFNNAEVYFKNAVVGINLNASKIENRYIKERILADGYIRTADCLFKQRNYLSARTFYDKAISQREGNYVYAIFQKAIIEGLIGDVYVKILSLEKIRDEYKDSDYIDDALVQLGDTHLGNANVDQAAISFMKLVTDFDGKSPYINYALLKLGLINYNRGNVAAALQNYKKVVNNKPSPKERQEAITAIEEIYIQDLNNSAGFVAFLDSIPGLALDAFKRDSINYVVGENLYKNGNYAKAIDAFSSYLTSYPSGFFNLKAYYFRAESYAIEKKYDKALKDYEFLIQEAYSEFFVRSIKKAAVISYNHTQNFEKALKYYQFYENQVKDDAEKYFAQLGAMRSAFRGGKDDAIITFANKVNANPLATLEERASALYYLGKSYYKADKLDQAKVTFNQVDQLSNSNQAAESRYLVAEILFKQKNYELAKKQCEYTNEKSVNYPYWIAKSLILMSDLFVLEKDYFNARAVLEAVIENFKDDMALTTEAERKLKAVKELDSKDSRIKGPNTGKIEMDNKNKK